MTLQLYNGGVRRGRIDHRERRTADRVQVFARERARRRRRRRRGRGHFCRFSTASRRTCSAFANSDLHWSTITTGRRKHARKTRLHGHSRRSITITIATKETIHGERRRASERERIRRRRYLTTSQPRHCRSLARPFVPSSVRSNRGADGRTDGRTRRTRNEELSEKLG